MECVVLLIYLLVCSFITIYQHYDQALVQYRLVLLFLVLFLLESIRVKKNVTIVGRVSIVSSVACNKKS